jgi:hypothetical protein
MVLYRYALRPQTGVGGTQWVEITSNENHLITISVRVQLVQPFNSAGLCTPISKYILATNQFSPGTSSRHGTYSPIFVMHLRVQ